jgi:heme/copper-type cytochrome/quinol oxidase subunit 2
VNTDKLHLGIVAVVGITAFFTLIVVVFVVCSAIKDRDEMPLDLWWSLIPFLVSMGIFVWASIVFFGLMPQNTSPK